MKFLNNRVAPVLVGATLLVSLGGVGGAFASGQITGAQIKDQTIHAIDIATGGVGSSEIKNGTVQSWDLAPNAKSSLHGTNGTNGTNGTDGTDGKDGAKGAKGDPGLSNLAAGAGYNNTWVGDNGATLQTARGECGAGQYATGGGFSTWGGDKDLGGDNKNIQVTVSAPYFEGDYVPVNAGGDFRPTEWVIKGYNNGTTDQIVRPWVICADVAN